MVMYSENRKSLKKNTIDMSKDLQNSMRSMLKDKYAEDAAWLALTHQPGLLVWRVKNFQLELVSPNDYGTFFEGDSYIILHTFLDISNKISYDVFIWIGKLSSADEYGTCVHKMAELDMSVLNGVAIQHREMQSHESDKFTALFPRMTIMKGGYQTGFSIVQKDVPEPRLLHISGLKKNVKIEEVSYHRNKLSEDDVFVVDLGENIYQINGFNCSKDEKFKGGVVLNDIKSKRAMTKADIIDYFTLSMNHPVIDAMPTEKKSNMKETKPTQIRDKSIWRLSDESGAIKMTKVSNGSITKSMLDSKDVFIVDGCNTIYIWVGKDTSRTEKIMAISYGQNYADSIDAHKISLLKVAEGNEPEDMLRLFE